MKFVRCYIWLRDLDTKETGKYLESFEMWCWMRTEKIKWPEKVTNEQVLDRIGEKRTFLNNFLPRKVIGAVIYSVIYVILCH